MNTDNNEEIIDDFWSTTFPHIRNIYDYDELNEKERFNELVAFRKKYISQNANNIDEFDINRMECINKIFNDYKRNTINKLK